MTMLSIVMTLISLAFLYFVIKMVNNSKFTLDYALIWMGVAIILVIFSLFPSVPGWFASVFGFELTSNFLLFMAVLFCLVQLIFFTRYLTKQNNQIKTLIQEVSILKEKVERKDK